MAFIHKQTFELIQGSNIDHYLDDYFEVDDLIAAPIQILNQKGYTTLFSCAGHPFTTVNEMMVDFETTPETSPVPNTFRVETLMTATEEGMMHRILSHDNINRYTDITFAKNTQLPHFPAGFFIKLDQDDGSRLYLWENDDGNQITDALHGTATLTKRYDADAPLFDFYAAQLDGIRTLYEWALSLPKIQT